jgi:cell division protease FtsH
MGQLALKGKSSLKQSETQKTLKFLKSFRKNNIIPNYERAEKTPIWQQVLIFVFPMLLLFVCFFFFLCAKFKWAGGKAMSFGKSKARLLSESKQSHSPLRT